MGRLLKRQANGIRRLGVHAQLRQRKDHQPQLHAVGALRDGLSGQLQRSFLITAHVQHLRRHAQRAHAGLRARDAQLRLLHCLAVRAAHAQRHGVQRPHLRLVRIHLQAALEQPARLLHVVLPERAAGLLGDLRSPAPAAVQRTLQRVVEVDLLGQVQRVLGVLPASGVAAVQRQRAPCGIHLVAAQLVQGQAIVAFGGRVLLRQQIQQNAVGLLVTAHLAVHLRQIQLVFPVLRGLLHRAAQQLQRVHWIVVPAVLHRAMVHIGRAAVDGYNLGVMLH